MSRCIACNAKLSEAAPIEETLCLFCLGIAKNPNKVDATSYAHQDIWSPSSGTNGLYRKQSDDD